MLFLFICEFTMGQVPGMPRLIRKETKPLVYTINFSSDQGFTRATIKAQIINAGNSPIVKSGVLWSYSIPTYDQYTVRTEDGDINGNPYQVIFTSLPTDVAIYFRVYAITLAGEYVYGQTLYTPVMTVISPYTGKKWMARNLGATADPIVQNGGPVEADTASYGYLYQWGRGNDGHQIVRPYRTISRDANGNPAIGTTPYSQAVTATYANYSNIPVGNLNKYISNSGNNNWITNNTTAWGGSGERNPCPDGFRVPHSSDFNNEFYVATNYQIYSRKELFESFLRLPITGWRQGTTGAFASYFTYDQGMYWTSVSKGTNTAEAFWFSSAYTFPAEDHFRTQGKNFACAIRCISW
jgi:uncharacterized protein (TIGR02145 family)